MNQEIKIFEDWWRDCDKHLDIKSLCIRAFHMGMEAQAQKLQLTKNKEVSFKDVD